MNPVCMYSWTCCVAWNWLELANSSRIRVGSNDSGGKCRSANSSDMQDTWAMESIPSVHWVKRLLSSAEMDGAIKV